MKFSQLFDRFGQSRPGFGRVRDRLGSWIDKRCHRLISLRPGLSQEASDWLAGRLSISNPALRGIWATKAFRRCIFRSQLSIRENDRLVATQSYGTNRTLPIFFLSWRR